MQTLYPTSLILLQSIELSALLNKVDESISMWFTRNEDEMFDGFRTSQILDSFLI